MPNLQIGCQLVAPNILKDIAWYILIQIGFGVDRHSGCIGNLLPGKRLGKQQPRITGHQNQTRLHNCIQQQRCQYRRLLELCRVEVHADNLFYQENQRRNHQQIAGNLNHFFHFVVPFDA